MKWRISTANISSMRKRRAVKEVLQEVEKSLAELIRLGHTIIEVEVKNVIQ